MRFAGLNPNATLGRVRRVGENKQPRHGFGPVVARPLLARYWDTAVRDQLLAKAMSIFHSTCERYHIVSGGLLTGRNKKVGPSQQQSRVPSYAHRRGFLGRLDMLASGALSQDLTRLPFLGR